MPAVLGHEGSGVIESVGFGVTGVEPGDHVVLSFDYDGRARTADAATSPTASDSTTTTSAVNASPTARCRSRSTAIR